MGNEPLYSSRPSGATGWEIIGPDGTTIAWANETYWAMLVAALLNKTENEGLGWHETGSASEAEETLAERRI